MKSLKMLLISALLLVALEVTGSAQEPKTLWAVVKRATFVIDYHEDEKASVTMAGTLPGTKVTGRAEARRQSGRTMINLRFAHLSHPQELGVDYTCYVIWAITPEGIADNLGRLRVSKDGSAEFEITTFHQPVGLIVSAEPYPLVRYPGPMIVAENLLDQGTRGRMTQRVIEYEGDPGIFYGAAGRAEVSSPPDYDTPLNVLGARRAVEIARRASAGRYAKKELQRAASRLEDLEQLWLRYLADRNDNPGQDEEIRSAALEVMRLAETARTVAVEQATATRVRTETSLARLEQAETDRLAPASFETELAQALNLAERGLTRVERVQARERIIQLETERAELESEQSKLQREGAIQRLQRSISEILETRRNERGLIVILSDSLFVPNQAPLVTKAKDGLNRLSSLLRSYRGDYRLRIEGATDSADSEASSRILGGARAASVRTYLLGTGLSANRFIAVEGNEKINPISIGRRSPGRPVNCLIEIIMMEANGESSGR